MARRIFHLLAGLEGEHCAPSWAGPTSMFVSCGPPTDGQLRAARRVRRLENGLANGATPVALETSQAARPPGTATAARQLLELVRRRHNHRSICGTRDYSAGGRWRDLARGLASPGSSQRSRHI